MEYINKETMRRIFARGLNGTAFENIRTPQNCGDSAHRHQPTTGQFIIRGLLILRQRDARTHVCAKNGETHAFTVHGF